MVISERRSLLYLNFSCSDGITEPERWIDILLETGPKVIRSELIIVSLIRRTLGLLPIARTPSYLFTSNPIFFRICHSSTFLRSVYRVLSVSCSTTSTPHVYLIFYYCFVWQLSLMEEPQIKVPQVTQVGTTTGTSTPNVCGGDAYGQSVRDRVNYASTNLMHINASLRHSTARAWYSPVAGLSNELSQIRLPKSPHTREGR